MIISDIIEILVYFIFVVTVIPTGITTCKKLYDNVKNEEHLEKGKILQRITKTYAVAQCIVWPFIAALSFMLMVNKRLLTFLSPTWTNSLIILGRFVYTVFSTYLACNSLLVATIRYVFVVCDKIADRFGIDKLRKVFLFASFSVPIFIAVLNEAMMPIANIWIKIFMPTTNEVLRKEEFGHLLQPDNSTYFIKSSPLFWFTSNYLHSTFNDIWRVICQILVFLVFSNIIEGFIYMHIYCYYKR